MNIEESKLEAQNEQLDIPVVSDSFKMRSVDLSIDAIKDENGLLEINLRTKSNQTNFTFSEKQIEMFITWFKNCR